MKLRYALLLISCTWLIHTSASGQCVEAIPAQAIRVDVDGPVADQGMFYWVCEGRTVEFNNQFAIAYIEANCTVTLSAPNGGIFYVNSNSTVNITGPFFSVTYDPNTVVTDNGNSTMLSECETLQFDRTNAPVPGCFITTGLAEVERSTMSIFPNPARNASTIRISGPNVSAARLFDLHGRMVAHHGAQADQLDIAGLAPGMYIVEANTGSGTWRERLMVE